MAGNRSPDGVPGQRLRLTFLACRAELWCVARPVPERLRTGPVPASETARAVSPVSRRLNNLPGYVSTRCSPSPNAPIRPRSTGTAAPPTRALSSATPNCQPSKIATDHFRATPRRPARPPITAQHACVTDVEPEPKLVNRASRAEGDRPVITPRWPCARPLHRPAVRVSRRAAVNSLGLSMCTAWPASGMAVSRTWPPAAA